MDWKCASLRTALSQVTLSTRVEVIKPTSDDARPWIPDPDPNLIHPSRSGNSGRYSQCDVKPVHKVRLPSARLPIFIHNNTLQKQQEQRTSIFVNTEEQFQTLDLYLT